MIFTQNQISKIKINKPAKSITEISKSLLKLNAYVAERSKIDSLNVNPYGIHSDPRKLLIRTTQYLLSITPTDPKLIPLT